MAPAVTTVLTPGTRKTRNNRPLPKHQPKGRSRKPSNTSGTENLPSKWKHPKDQAPAEVSPLDHPSIWINANAPMNKLWSISAYSHKPAEHPRHRPDEPAQLHLFVLLDFFQSYFFAGFLEMVPFVLQPLVQVWASRVNIHLELCIPFIGSHIEVRAPCDTQHTIIRRLPNPDSLCVESPAP